MPTSPRQPLGQAPRAPATASRAIPAAIFVFALAGLAVAADLWLVHRRAHSGLTSFCDIGSRVSCTDVALSRWADVFGVPTAAWGALAYLAVAALALSAIGRRRASPTWPGGLLLILTGLMSAGSVLLAGYSELVLRKLCLLCAASWAISLALLALSTVLVRRAGGVGAAVRADLQVVRGRPMAAAAGAAGLAAIALALLLFPAPPPRAPAAGVAAQAGSSTSASAVIPVGEPGSLVVYEYSDYLCPFCARMHAGEKKIAEKRPDVRVVRRHFPLDSACNPRIRTAMHEGSCDLSRGAICAEKQGRFEAYDDAAFASQASRPGPEALAQQVGLDLAAFRKCLDAPETRDQLAADIKSGIDVGVNATPSFLVRGRLERGDRFLELLGLSTEVTQP